MVIRVAVNGFGTIGKRVADAVSAQPDMKLIGIAKTRPSFEATVAVEKHYPIFLAGSGSVQEFDRAGIPVAGRVEEMLAQADVIVDAAPDKVGKENLPLYEAAKARVIFQGGEKAEVAQLSFNALANFAQAKGARRVRVVSCNTTGLARAASVLIPRYGVERWDATIVRRAADPAETKKGPINGILPTFHLPSHHGPDVRTIFPDLPIATQAVVVPTTLMHVHVNHVRLRKPPASTEEILAAFRSTPRFLLFRGWEHVEGTPQVVEYGRDHGFPRGDVMRNVLWEEGVKLDGSDLYFFQAIHQESVVVPENIDAIRAMLELAPDAASSIRITDRTLGLAG
jgi:glyceraldehyde-3-phosphate dehydrogenase (NAD(P)+) (phosphorylating)